ncbi:MAG: SDR family NAD(P)-dependent oxidoreductase [Saprospiraceae bacterium]|nr:SDR family NAD(P)-dependent oxidoreductase [Saprospiraceae bacterium]
MLSISQQFPAKRAFITGTASGLGRELSLLLAKDGWTIGMCDINENGLQAVKAEVEKQGGQALPYLLDTSNRQQFESVAKDYLAETGGIDLLINNAGVGDGEVFHEYSLDNWDWMVGINQMGVVYGCYFFVPILRKQKSGHIINISSAASFSNAPGMAAYSATKAAVRSLSETLYYELAPLGVKVSVAMPTFFKTNIMKHGKGKMINTARKLVEESGIEADTIAREILAKAAAGKLHIVLPKQARKMFWVARIFPSVFRKQLLKISEKMFKKGIQTKDAKIV